MKNEGAFYDNCKICIFAHVYSFRMIDSCILDTTSIANYVIWRDEYTGGRVETNSIISEEELDEKRVDEYIWIVEGEREERRLCELNIQQKNIVRLYNNESKIKIHSLKGVFDKKRFKMLMRIHRLYYSNSLYWIVFRHMPLAVRERIIGNWIGIFLKDYDKKFAILGNTKLCDMVDAFLNKTNNQYYCGEISLLGVEGRKSITDLIYVSNKNDFTVFCTNRNSFRKSEEFLLDNGFSRQNIQIIGNINNFHGSGSAERDIYDYFLGYSRELKDQPMGFKVFSNINEASQKKYTILILGGSTSDPTTANIDSWGECLFNSADDMGIPVEIWVGGISGYTVSQELLKLIRDGCSIEPDLVISYSGVNDSTGLYYDENAPYTRYDQRQIIESGNLSIRFGNGAYKRESRARHWYKCECMMHGISQELGARFYGILQPWNEKGSQFNISNMRNRQEFYSEAKELIKQKDYLLDFTSIFADSDDFFFDCEHVYEKGNRRIARRILPLVLRDLKDRR